MNAVTDFTIRYVRTFQVGELERDKGIRRKRKSLKILIQQGSKPSEH